MELDANTIVKGNNLRFDPRMAVPCMYCAAWSRSHLKNVFWPNIFVGASFQILDTQQYASGLRPTKITGSGGKSRFAGKRGRAAILNQKPIFGMASIHILRHS